MLSFRFPPGDTPSPCSTYFITSISVKLERPDSPESPSSFHPEKNGTPPSFNDCSRNRSAAATSLSLGCKCRLRKAGQPRRVTVPKHEESDVFSGYFHLSTKKKEKYTQGNFKRLRVRQLTWFEHNSWLTSQCWCQKIWVP